MLTSGFRADELALRAQPGRLDSGNKANKQIYMPASPHGVLHKCTCAPLRSCCSLRAELLRAQITRSVKWVVIAGLSKKSWRRKETARSWLEQERGDTIILVITSEMSAILELPSGTRIASTAIIPIKSTNSNDVTFTFAAPPQRS